ncbi:MAG: hypothetical protein IJW27_03790 [Clostridia bacterium]|nr:hypothetical protein [Clostridia bacterium]
MKRFTAVLLCLAIALSFSACGKAEKAPSSSPHPPLLPLRSLRLLPPRPLLRRPPNSIPR